MSTVSAEQTLSSIRRRMRPAIEAHLKTLAEFFETEALELVEVDPVSRAIRAVNMIHKAPVRQRMALCQIKSQLRHFILVSNTYRLTRRPEQWWAK